MEETLSRGRTVLAIKLYSLYFILGVIAIPYCISLIAQSIGLPTRIFMIVIAPIASLIIPKTILRRFPATKRTKIIWYIVHCVAVIVVPIVVFVSFILIAIQYMVPTMI
jgi:hypothetical protein